MMQRLYAMFDRKAMSYGSPMAFVNDEVARRAVLNIVMGDGEIKNFPGDFDMYMCGFMDTDSAVITPEPVPYMVFNCGELIAAAQGGRN